MTSIRINLCSSPRNISTALMYAFGNRADMAVVDEPLYAYYLKLTGKKHPAWQETLQSMPCNTKVVIDEMLSKNYGKPFVFFKNMTHHYIGLSDDDLTRMLSGTTNVVLIRDPKEMIASFSKVIPNPTEEDLGITMQLELVKRLQKLGTLACVVDSNDILKNPKGMLTKVCESCGISFSDEMLSWEAGNRVEDGVWAKHWYDNVHQSTGFKPYQKKVVELPENLEPLYEACLPHYEALKGMCLIT